jgi:hypothetical protein
MAVTGPEINAVPACGANPGPIWSLPQQLGQIQRVAGSKVSPQLDFVTVVFRGELGALRLQARSLARFMAPHDVSSIFIVINDIDEVACFDAVQAILPEYGALRDRVQVLRPDAILRWPRAIDDMRSRLSAVWKRLRGRSGAGWRGRSGWFMQQALKLATARVTTAPVVVIMDAKNHLIAPCDSGVFATPDGRARATLMAYDDYHFNWLRNAHRFLGSPEPDRDAPNLPTTTPFVVTRDDLMATLAAVEARGSPVQGYFRPRPNQEIEFSLIAAWSSGQPGGWQARFVPDLPDANAIFRYADADQIERGISRAEAGASPFFAVHRAAADRLSVPDADRIAALWRRNGLLEADRTIWSLLGSGQAPTDG